MSATADQQRGIVIWSDEDGSETWYGEYPNGELWCCSAKPDGVARSVTNPDAIATIRRLLECLR